MHWYGWASIPVVFFGFWIYTSMMARSFPSLTGKRILMLIAHPDDEVMFFGPTLLALTRPEAGNHVKILCLSSGNADGLGEVRKRELVKSVLILGIRSSDDVLVLDDENFQDSQNKWDSKKMADLLLTGYAPKMPKLSPKSAPETNIDAIVTFDAGGVSSHPNHYSCYFGAVQFIKTLMSRHSGWECPVALYTLTSISMWRKYLFVLDAPFTILACIGRRKEISAMPSPLLFVSGLGGYRAAWQAMVTAHKSQMVWFRWLYITFGRYMVMNDLRKVKVA
ncbi:phosphatidylinositol glycan class L [Tothia fuscella]|uniref:N-acetylglucosaminylphosphatidylinositol deacetylase n=1 Tax=Tothia fuscella TaxID=1048955 RepID=A0A9P4NW50_9PEZI|nr:phosphatidylinositol glycan class L [Tothia fuscella]